MSKLFISTAISLLNLLPFVAYAMEMQDKPGSRKASVITEKNKADSKLKNIIASTMHCRRNAYCIPLKDVPQSVKNYVLDELEKQYKPPQQRSELIGIVSALSDKSAYDCAVDFAEVDEWLTKPSLPEERPFRIAVGHDYFSIVEKAPLRKRKNGSDLGRWLNFIHFVDKSLSSDQIRKIDSIGNLTIEQQEAIIDDIEAQIFSQKITTDITIEFTKQNITYTGTMPAEAANEYKQWALLGPLQQVEKKRLQSDDPKLIFDDSSSNLGNLVYSPNFMTSILHDSIEPGMTVLEIGAAKGIESFKMLSRGARVTAVDLSGKDLAFFKQNTRSKFMDNLSTIVANFPDDLNIEIKTPDDKFDIIYMSHVAHYLTGPQLREGINKIASWLKPNTGRFYFQALTPYSNPYSWNLVNAENNVDKEEWPAFFSEEFKRAEAAKRPVKLYHGDGMPDFGHPIYPHIIERELKRRGFTIDYIGYTTLSHAELFNKPYPLSYQEFDDYVKRLVKPISPKRRREIERKLSQAGNPMNGKTWMDLLNAEAFEYRRNHEFPNEVAQSLATMEIVVVIASIDCQ